MGVRLRRIVVAAAFGPIACGGSTPAPPNLGTTSSGDAGTTTVAASDTNEVSSTGDSAGETGMPMPLPPWTPGVVYPSTREPDARGFVDLRGPIHTHSPYSHDACDGMPRDANGNLDAQCMEDLRAGLCLVQHDFAFFTDHRDSFSDSEFPDVLLYDETLGDALVERDGIAVASWAGCEGLAPGVLPTLVTAGCEVGGTLMPIGLEGHAPGRGDTYGSATPEAIAELHAAGALVLVAHLEDFEPQQILDLPLDGYEMYNVHANMLANLGAALALLGQISEPDSLPHPELLLLPIFSEDPRYLERWATILARGGRHVTTMASDAHRNTFPEELPDGERVDSFRRMMRMFSNHLRITPEADGTWDDRHLKEALAARRLYGAFEYLGYPEGFDARIEVGDEVREIGDEASLADAAEIVAVRPAVRGLDPAATPPIVQLRVLFAREGGFDVLADTTGPELRFVPTSAGAYRVEVRIAPRHLAGYLGAYEDQAEVLRPWIYANAFYIVE